MPTSFVKMSSIKLNVSRRQRARQHGRSFLGLRLEGFPTGMETLVTTQRHKGKRHFLSKGGNKEEGKGNMSHWPEQFIISL